MPRGAAFGNQSRALENGQPGLTVFILCFELPQLRASAHVQSANNARIVRLFQWPAHCWKHGALNSAGKERPPPVKIILSLLLSVSLISVTSIPCLAQGKGYKAQYKGGTLLTKGDSGRLFITSDIIRLNMKQGETLEINPKNVTTLSYGKEASRRVALWLTLGIVLTPWLLFGLFAKRKNHYIGIEYKDGEGKAGAILIRADKKEYMPMLVSLRSITGQKILGLDDKPSKKDDWTVMEEDKKP